MSGMKKAALSALALGGYVFAGFAQAQSNVTVYGIVDTSVRHATHAGAGGKSLTTEYDALFAPSRLGFKGTEDLGGGMQALFQLEEGFDPSQGTFQQSTAAANYGQGVAPNGRAWGREAFVGLATPLGTVTMGRQTTLAHNFSGRFQPFANPNLDALSGFSVHHVARQDNMVKYQFTRGPGTVAASVTASEGNGKAWAVAGGYTFGGLDVVTLWQQMDSFDSKETRKIFDIGGSYAITPTVKGFLGYMKRSQRVSAQRNQVVSLGATWQATDQWLLWANVLQDKQTHLNAGNRLLTYVTADYSFSKRTGVYVEVDRNRLSGAYPLTSFMTVRGSQTGVAAGLRVKF